MLPMCSIFITLLWCDPKFCSCLEPKPQTNFNALIRIWFLWYWKNVKICLQQNLHIVKTTALITTKFCTTIETTKYSSWLVQIRARQIQDGGRPPFEKLLNRDISTTIWPILTKFYAYSKSNMAAAAILDHFDQNCCISPMAQPVFTKFGIWCRMGPLSVSAIKIFILKIQDGRRLPFWKNR